MTMVATTLTAADAARVPLMLSELRLPTIKRLWADMAEQSNREGWPAQRFLGALLEHEMADARPGDWRAHASIASCRRARAWPSSTSRLCRPSPKPTSWRWQRPTAG